jgi:hypothetical protein
MGVNHGLFTLREQYGLGVFANRVLSKILGPRRVEGEYNG